MKTNHKCHVTHLGNTQRHTYTKHYIQVTHTHWVKHKIYKQISYREICI